MEQHCPLATRETELHQAHRKEPLPRVGDLGLSTGRTTEASQGERDYESSVESRRTFAAFSERARTGVFLVPPSEPQQHWQEVLTPRQETAGRRCALIGQFWTCAGGPGEGACPPPSLRGRRFPWRRCCGLGLRSPTGAVHPGAVARLPPRAGPLPAPSPSLCSSPLPGPERPLPVTCSALPPGDAPGSL